MFVLSSREGAGSNPECLIIADTTDPEQLKLALKLQELIFRIGGVRLPLADNRCACVGSNCVGHWPRIVISAGVIASGNPPRYKAIMFEADQNGPRQIQVQANGTRFLEEALSAFTKAAFGMELAAVDDPKFRWPRRNIVAIRGNFKPIVGSPRFAQ
jgi:hypothetical protein